MPIEAKFGKFGTFVALVAENDAASVLEVGGKQYLQGSFALRIHTQNTKFAPIEASAKTVQVAMVAGDWTVVHCKKTRFAYPQGQAYLSRTPGSPVLRGWAPEIMTWYGEPVFDFGNAAISAFAGFDPLTQMGMFVHPIANGGQAAAPMNPWSIEHGARVGFLVNVREDGTWIRSGGRNQAHDFDHIDQIEFAINGETFLDFKIAEPDGSPASEVEFSTLADGEMRMAIETASNAKLLGLDAGGTGDKLRPSRLRISGGYIVADGFHAKEIEAQFLQDGESRVAIKGLPDQFRMLLHIPETAGTALPPEPAQVVFSDARVEREEDYTDHRQRFHGVRIEKMQSTRTGKETLDSSLATLTLEGSSFVLRAGDKVKLIEHGNELPSKLLPKGRNFETKAGQRLLDSSVGHMRLAILDNPNKAAGLKLEARAASSKLRLAAPELKGRPLGSPASDGSPTAKAAGDKDEVYEEWTWHIPSPIDLDINVRDVKPDPDIFEQFESKWQDFDLLDAPGTSFATWKRDGDESHERVFWDEKKALLSFAVISGVLTYGRYKHGNWDVDTWFRPDKVKFSVKTYKGNAYKDAAKYTIGRATNDLRLLFDGSDPEGQTAIREWINLNLDKPSPSLTEPAYGIFPFALGLGLLMRQSDLDGEACNKRGGTCYCFDIADHRFQKTSMIGFDYSERETLPVDQLFGVPTWRDVAELNNREAEALWPRARARQGVQLDPSSPRWAGLFFRNLPIIIKPPEEVEGHLKDYPLLLNLYRHLNRTLLLDYGWIDAHGTTWLMSYNKPLDGSEISLVPLAWADVIKLTLEDAKSLGSGGKLVGGTVDVRLVLPWLEDNNGNQLDIVGKFDFDVTAPNALAYVSFKFQNDWLSTSKVPGFDKVKIASIGTDWSSINIDLHLVAGAALAKAVPAFKSTDDEPIKAQLAINPSGKVSGVVDFTLPSPIKTYLFGKFPLIVEAIKFDITQTALEVGCRVDLGLPGLENWKLRLLVNAQGDIAVKLDGISGKIDFGDLELEGKLSWKGEDFIGALGIKGGIFGSGKKDGFDKNGAAMYCRVGSQGTRPYWISAISYTGTVGITSSAGVKDPVLMLSHGMDYDEGKFYKALTQIDKPLTALRPSSIGQGWLDQWKFSPNVGTGLAVSGFLELNKTIAPSTSDMPNAKENYLSSFVITDDGRVRADAWIKLFAKFTTRIVIAIDLKQKEMAAGMQLPSMNVPPAPAQPKVEFSPGFFSVEIGYGSTRRRVKLKMGWPERKGNSEFERDWNKSSRVKIDDMVPLNTFWGGWMAEYRQTPEMFRFGYAIRAGWTKKYKFGGEGIASAEAELGITLGGVVMFAIYDQTDNVQLTIDFDRADLSTELQDASSRALSTIRRTHRRSNAIAKKEMCLSAELYGDIWGRGSAKFMGITLASIDVSIYVRFRACGSLDQGIMSAKGHAGYKVSVTIACVTYRAWAETDVVVKDGGCPENCSDTLALSPAFTSNLQILPLLMQRAA